MNNENNNSQFGGNNNFNNNNHREDKGNSFSKFLQNQNRNDFNHQKNDDRNREQNKQVNDSGNYSGNQQINVIKRDEAVRADLNRSDNNHVETKKHDIELKKSEVKGIKKVENNGMPGTNQRKHGILEGWAYKIFFLTVAIMPIAFIPSKFIAIDVAKSIVLSVGVLLSAICYGFLAIRERKIALPPKSITWSGALLIVSLFISSALSVHFGKSIFGQGFEIGTAAMILIMLTAAFIAHEAVRRNNARVLSIYGVLYMVFIVVFLFQVLRLVFGPTFMTLAILNSPVSTLLGGWNNLAIFAGIIFTVLLTAVMTLQLSGKIKWFYYIVALAAFLTMYLVNHQITWMALLLTMIIFGAVLWYSKQVTSKTGLARCIAKTSWPVTIITIAVAVLWYFGITLSGPVISATNTQYAEVSLPWQVTIDIVGGAIKNYPIFGIGPNHFAQAFMVYKPVIFNQTAAWGIEFPNGFGLIPTLFAAQGTVGIVLWILFTVFMAIMIARVFRDLPAEREKKFVLLSSGLSFVFLWLMLILYVPSHAIVFLTFVMAGIFVAVASSNGKAKDVEIDWSGSKAKAVMTVVVSIIILIVVYLLLIFVRKAIAVSYFSSGIKALTVSQNLDIANAKFKSALSMDYSDIYLQALAEDDRMMAAQVISTATSSSQEVSDKISSLLNSGISAAREAIKYDPTNYYNYVAEGRVSALGAGIKVSNAYDNAVRAYSNAIAANRLNPSLYLALAQVQAAEGKYDDSLASVGRAIQLKDNYLDAVFFLSQLQATRGNLQDAVIAAQVATQINPSDPTLFFQLGLLLYNAKDYKDSAIALEKAVSLQPQYANAKYFLGLSYARLNKSAEAIAQFEDLEKSNPDNQEISMILSNLRAGKMPFNDVKASAPEKRSELPVKEKRQ